MTRRLSDTLPPITLLAWGAVLLWYFMDGRVSGMLVPMFRPMVAIAGTLLLALGAALAWLPREEDEDDCCGHDACAHALGRMSWGRALMFAILILPITATALYSPEGFGRKAIENRGIAMTADGLSGGLAAPPLREPPLPTRDGAPAAEETFVSTNAYLPRTPEGRLDAQITDLLFAAQDPGLQSHFENEPLEIIGQLLPATVNNPRGNRAKLVRMFMSCCAADARPTGLLIETTAPTNGMEMAWVKVIGVATFTMEGGRNLPVIRAESVSVIEAPQEPFLY